MAVRTQTGDVPASGAAAMRPGERAPYRDRGAQIFIWIAWALAFAFWVFSMGIDVGIIHDIAQGGPGSFLGGVDAGGAQFFLLTVLGVIALGIAIAYGAARWATRDRRMDPVTEASTAALYDSIEIGRRGGGSSSAPRRPSGRETYRSA